MSLPAPAACLVFGTDELGTRLLERLAGSTGLLRYVASFTKPGEAQALLQAHPEAEVLLVEVETTKLAGLELVRGLTKRRVPLEIILVTSSPDFAVEAFNLHVADYLLKPVRLARFREAAELVSRRCARAAALGETTPGPHPITRVGPAPSSPATPTEVAEANAHDLFVKVNNRLVRLNFNEVLYLEAMSTYCVFVTARQKYIVHATLKNIVARLPISGFRRVHRSYLVNTRLIDSIEGDVLMLGGHQVPLAKSYQSELLRSLRSL